MIKCIMMHLTNIDKYYDSKFQRTIVLKAVKLDVKKLIEHPFRNYNDH